MAKGDSKEFIEYKVAVLRGAINYLNRDDSMDSWWHALPLDRRNNEYYDAAQALHRYIIDALEPSLNYFWWLKQHRPEEKRSLKECMIAWAEWMISCLREDSDAIWEEERRRRNSDGSPRPREERTIIIKLG